MAGNYAAVLTAWRLLCDFADIDRDQGDFIHYVVTGMNNHITDTDADREPWVWIIEILLSEIAAGQYRHPYKFDIEDGETVLCVRSSHIMDHIAHSMALRDKWNALPVKSDRVLKRQLNNADVLAKDDIEREINQRREAHLVAISLGKLEKFGLHAAPPIKNNENESSKE